MIQFRPIFLVPLCLLGSCALFSENRSDTSDQPVMEKRVDNSMLQHVAADERGELTDARQAADVARDAHAAAKVDTQNAIDRRKLADRDLEIAQAELKRAEAAMKIAENGTQEELVQAKQTVSDAKALVASVRSRTTLRDRQVDLTKALEDLSLRNNELAQAKVEATKAHAVKELDRPQAKSIDVGTFEHQVRECQEKVQLAEVRVDAARKEVKAARTSYDDSVKAVPASFRRDWPREDDEPKEVTRGN